MKRLGVVAALAVLTGCATPYQETGFAGGFSETRLAENIVKVRFAGNGFTSAERVSDMAMLRSAQITKQSGFAYFAVVDADETNALSTFVTPTTTTTTGQATLYGNSLSGSAQSTTTGGQVLNFNKPGASNTVVMFREKPADGMALSADFICQSIGPKYKVTC